MSTLSIYTFEELLLKLGFGDLNFHCLIHLLVVAPLMIRVILDRGGKEGVDERSFAQAGLSSDLQFVSRRFQRHHRDARTMIVNAAPRFATILCLDLQELGRA